VQEDKIQTPNIAAAHLSVMGHQRQGPQPRRAGQALDAAVTSETNPDNVGRALEMYSGHPERAVNLTPLIDG
jgi:hypothetical protein